MYISLRKENSMNILVSRLILYVNTCSKKDVVYEIANYIIKNYLNCNEITLKMIMDECYVSRTSVTRFCEYFGYRSWDSFQSYLIRTKKGREQQMINRINSVDIKKLYQRLYLLVDGNEETNRLLKEYIDKLVELIYQCDQVRMFGAVYPLSLALEFQTNMISLGKVVHNDYQSGNDNCEAIETLGDDELAIILTASGRFISEAHAKFNSICNSLAKKVIITSNDRYHNIQYIDQYIYIPTNEINGYDNFNYYVILILDIVYLEYAKKYCMRDE